MSMIAGACGGTVGGGPAPDGGGDAHGADASGIRTTRFVMMGDQGTGDANQLAVAAGIQQVCARDGCDFVVLLGDNLYEDGADSVVDPVWQREFEGPYAGIDLPFHALLGNHDYGPTGTDVERSDNEIAYTSYSTKWKMPSEHYTLVEGAVGFVMLDTTSFILDSVVDGDQRAWWPSALAAARAAPWVIAAGHHPYLSNGINGGASHDGPVFQAFMDDLVCGHVDLYVAGHDHDREWIDAPDRCGGTQLVISGAGGGTARFAHDEAPYDWHDDTEPGFLYVVADAHTLTARFVGADGVTDYERTLTK